MLKQSAYQANHFNDVENEWYVLTIEIFNFRIMRIVTWNSQGYKFGGYIGVLIHKLSPDVIVLQECGDIKIISDKWNPIPGTNRLDVCKWRFGSKKYNVFYYSWRADSRCSMATLIREDLVYTNPTCLEYTDIGKFEDDSEEYDTERQDLRGTIRIHVNSDGTDFYICNVHLPSGRPSFARKIGYAYIKNSSCLSSNMIMVGDFNTEPDTWKLEMSQRVVACKSSTHNSGHELDYAITNSTKSMAIEVVKMEGSDHYPVMIDIN